MFGEAQKERQCQSPRRRTLRRIRNWERRTRGRDKGCVGVVWVFIFAISASVFFRAEISLASWTAGNGFLRFALAYYLFVDWWRLLLFTFCWLLVFPCLCVRLCDFPTLFTFFYGRVARAGKFFRCWFIVFSLWTNWTTVEYDQKIRRVKVLQKIYAF